MKRRAKIQRGVALKMCYESMRENLIRCGQDAGACGLLELQKELTDIYARYFFYVFPARLTKKKNR